MTSTFFETIVKNYNKKLEETPVINTEKPHINPVVAAYEPYFLRILPTGSRVICSSPAKNSDEDYMILIDVDKQEALFEKLDADGWLIGGSLGENADTLNEKHTILEDGTLSNEHLFQSWKRYEIPATYNDYGDTTAPAEGIELNLLVTCNEDYFNDFTRATMLAKALNLENKQNRVILFEALTRDVWPDPNKKKEDKYIWEYKNIAPGSINYVVSPPVDSSLNWAWGNSQGTSGIMIHDEVQGMVDSNFD